MKQLKVIQRFKDVNDFSIHEVGCLILVKEDRANRLVEMGLCVDAEIEVEKTDISAEEPQPEKKVARKRNKK